MSTDLSRKKKLRGAHRASATRLQKTVSEVLISFDPNNLEEIVPKLNQLKTSMKEKLETLKVLDEEILELVDEANIEEEIEQCDICRESLQLALENVERALNTSSMSSLAVLSNVTENTTINSENNLKGLRQLHDTVQSHIRTLKSMGVAPESYGGLLSSMLMSKLPTNLQLVVSRVVKENEWNLDKLLNTLQQELEARERIKVPATNKDFKKYHGSASALMAGGPAVSTTWIITGGSRDCTTVTSPAARQDILRKTGRCFVCLRKDHISPSCKSTTRCYSCKGRHHVSICKGKKPPHRDPPEEHGQSGSNKSKESPSLGTHPDATVCHTTSSNCVLLQTARANIYNPDNPNGPKVKARLILDGGSQCSYVSRALTGTLGLQSKGQRSVNIKTFGSSETNAQVIDVVNLGIETAYGANIEMLAFNVPLICQPLKNQFVSNASKTYVPSSRQPPPS
ncbi:Hypothetical predicted protein [Paramuricea clavata]|uniref:Uncharacterized protein n=1 Tax=Paramuricea clavata TaxID=317549 RepID=A0A7D9DYQ4_PARCT|nr:Hypothetical predicted protein [Paramuricea clavata]